MSRHPYDNKSIGHASWSANHIAYTSCDEAKLALSRETIIDFVERGSYNEVNLVFHILSCFDGLRKTVATPMRLA